MNKNRQTWDSSKTRAKRKDDTLYIPPKRSIRVWGIILFCLIIFGFITLHFSNKITDIHTQTIEIQANAFKRMVNTAQRYGRTTGKDFIPFRQGQLFLNEYDLPAGTQPELHYHSSEQSASKCLDVWRSIFFHSSSFQIKQNRRDSVFAQVIDGKFCRYRLKSTKAGTYFFDYHFITGQVNLGQRSEKIGIVLN